MQALSRKMYFGALLSIVLILGLAMPTFTAHAVPVCVDPGDVTCFSTIQAAVTAATAGDTINVAAGTYVEQVLITKDLQLVGAGAGVSFIQAPPTLPAASNPNSYILQVSGAGVDAEITGFTITGPGPTACGSISSGIIVRDAATANIHDNSLVDIRDNAVPLSGCQNGNAILVGRNAWATTGTAAITNNTIIGYQKTGIVVDNAGSSATITGNTITGIGTTAITAQNGIQISRGADATLTGNTINGSSYHLDGSGWDWGSAGILLYQAGDVVLAGGNTVTGNDNALYNEGSASLTVGAETFGNSTAPVGSGYDVINLADYPLDLSGVTFLGSADNFGISDRIWDGLDDPALGVATVVTGNVYVSPLGAGIQAAIDAATAGDTVNVAAGTYVENPNVNKSLTLSGPNAAIDPTTGVRVAEAVIQGEVTVAANTVTVAGFTITNPSGKHGLTASERSGVHVSYNIIDEVGTTDPTTTGTNYAIAVLSSAAAVDDVQITHNLITDLAGGNFKSAQAIALGWSTGAYDFTNVLIDQNVIGNINSSILAYASGGRGAYGIILNHTTASAGSTVAPTISNNTICDLEGLWAHGIGLEGNTPNAVVTNNDICNLVDHKTPSDAVAIQVEDNASATTLMIEHNSFTNLAVGVQNVVAGDPLVNAANNYWGSIMPDWATMIVGNVTHTPWCIDAGCIAVTPFTTTTTITDLPDPTSRGNLVTINLSVANNTPLGPVPAGTVDVSDGTTEICSDVVLDGSGNGSCTYSFALAGTFTLTATFTPTDGVLIAGSSNTASHRVVNKPILLSPANAAQLLYNRPTFDWTDLLGSKTYRIQIATDSAFTNLLANSITTVSSYKPAGQLPANVTLWWRVRRETGVTSKWSKPFSFTTANPPSRPVLLLPANGALTQDLTPTLDWKNSILPAGTTLDHYRLQVFTVAGSPRTSIVLDKNRLGSLYTFTTDLAPGTYFWRVRSYNTDGEFSSWSPVWSFTVQP